MIHGSTCPQEADWQRYLLEADFPGRGEMDRHLKACGYCRFLLEQLGKEISELQTVWKEGSTRKIIHLQPLRIEEASKDRAITLLAAKGREESEQTLSLTLSSTDQELLLRAVRDQHSGDVWLYLMSDDPSLCRHVLVRPFGSEHEVLTDDNGRVNLGQIEWPSPENLTADVSLPRAVFQLSPIRDLPDPSSTATLNSSSGDSIRVSLEGQGRNRKLVVQLSRIAKGDKAGPLRIAVRGEGETGISHIRTVTPDKISFDNVDDHEILEIYLFE